MRGPSLQKTALLSFGLHLTAFLIALLILRQSSTLHTPSPYTVSLVSPDVLKGIDKGKNEDSVQESEKHSMPAETTVKDKKETAKDKAKDKEMIEKKISAIAAKKKIEKMVKLRSVISLRASGNKSSINAKITSPSQGKGSISDDYYSKIIKEIWGEWNCPPSICKKGLEAVVSVKILKDGTAIVQGVEKPSGNALFDRSAMKALAKASPLQPPPFEMEIGVRFYP